MTRAEIYKLRTQRHPLIAAAVLLVGVLTPSVVLIWYTPSDPGTYEDAFSVTFQILAILVAIEFGGWLLGAEYRQGTVKRLLTSEPRRVRALATKGAVGAAALSATLAAAAGLGWLAARLVGSMHDVTVPWSGRSLLAAGVTAVVAAIIAYSLSAITRSEAVAMVATLALLLVIDPMLSDIPRVGDYTMDSALSRMQDSIAGTAEATVNVSASTATITVAVWITAFLTGAVAMFAKRDV